MNQPLSGGGILTTPSELPRQVLLSLPGCTPEIVSTFEANMKQKRSAKAQKDFIRDLLRIAADAMPPSWSMDRAKNEESLLHATSRAPVVPNLPEKLVTHSKLLKEQRYLADQPEPGLGAFKLF